MLMIAKNLLFSKKNTILVFSTNILIKYRKVDINKKNLFDACIYFLK